MQVSLDSEGIPFSPAFSSEYAEASLSEEEIKVYLREQIKCMKEEAEQIIPMSQHLVNEPLLLEFANL